MLISLLFFRGDFDQECNPCVIGKMEFGPPNNVGLKCNCLTYITKRPLPKLAQMTLTPNSEFFFSFFFQQSYDRLF